MLNVVLRKYFFLSLFLLSGCSSNEFLYISSAHNQVSEVNNVSNGSLTFELNFMGQLQHSNGVKGRWTPEMQKPYIDAAKLWLSYLIGVEGLDKHTISFDIRVQKLSGGNGAAAVNREVKVDNFLISVDGEVIIANHTYGENFDPVEFNANIVHEFGHVIGFGFSTEKFVHHDRDTGGHSFRTPNSRAVGFYNQQHNTSFDFVPFSEDGAHLYDHVYQDDNIRFHRDETKIPPLTEEVMANGTTIGLVTLGILDDIGFEVDYRNAAGSSQDIRVKTE